jgi:ABC-type nitrate/sulfonate/bicarbonate transport system substrate-binding protein
MNPASAPIRHRRALATAVALLALSGLGLVACGDDASSDDGAAPASEELTRFTVVLDWTPNTNHAGMYLALAEGWYEEAGLEVTFVEPGEAGSLQVLASGRADAAVTVQEELLPARAAGLPVRSVAAIIESNTSSLVSLADDGIEAPADLAGARYGGFGGQLEAALLAELMRCDGADPDDLELVDVGEADYRIGLERDQYDVVWIFDGWDGIRLSEVEGVDTNAIRFIDHTDCIPDWYTPLLATSEDVEAERSDDLAAFLDATARGYRTAMADPGAAADALLAGADDLDPELVAASAEFLADRYAADPAAWGQQRAEVWDRFAAFLVDAGLLEGDVDVAAAWTNEHLPEP